MHPALKKACLAYFYSSSDKVLHQFPDFQEYILKRAFLLVGAMVCCVVIKFKSLIYFRTILDSFRAGNLYNTRVQQTHFPQHGPS